MKKVLSILMIISLVFIFGGCAANGEQPSNSEQSSNIEQSSSSEQSTTDDGKWKNVQVEFDADDYYSRLENCVKQIREKTDFVPDIALVLGSGLGALRVIHLLGAKTAVLTNAVGAINADYSVGDFVLNEDYISSFVPSPLVGENIDKLGDRFVDMTDAFDKDLNTIVENIANQNKIPIHKGVMIQVTGPQYESPTEIKMYRSLGADTVGMSTVVETIAARHMGMRVCSISCITNMAAGMQDKISHEEVQNSSNNSSKNFAVLVSGLLSKM